MALSEAAAAKNARVGNAPAVVCVHVLPSEDVQTSFSTAPVDMLSPPITQRAFLSASSLKWLRAGKFALALSSRQFDPSADDHTWLGAAKSPVTTQCLPLKAVDPKFLCGPNFCSGRTMGSVT